jgi:hypothetical protein
MAGYTKVEFEMYTQRSLDRDRGIALLVAGAVMVLLKWVVPIAAPAAVLAYGIYRLFAKQYKEGLIFVAVAVVLWLLRPVLGGLLWVVGFLMAALGVFYLIRSFVGASDEVE